MFLLTAKGGTGKGMLGKFTVEAPLDTEVSLPEAAQRFL